MTPNTSPTARCFRPATIEAVWPLFVALLLASALPLDAQADEFHYNSVFVGARSGGMGGTMVGLADDPSAAWYNPAGLARAPFDLVTLNATALQSRVLTLQKFLGRDVDLKSTSSLPLASVVTSPFAGGRLAFCGMTVDQEAFRVDETRSDIDPAFGLSQARIQRDRVDSTYLAGVAWGKDFGNDFDLGIAAYYVFRSYRENDSDFRSGVPNARGEVAFERVAAKQGLSHGGTLVLGLLYHPGGPASRGRLGLAVRTGANITDSAVANEEQFVGVPAPTEADPNGIRYERRTVTSRRDAHSKIPPALLLGGSFRLTPGWVVALDGSLYGFVEYESLGEKITKLATANLSLGSELALSPELLLRAGLYTNRSSAPKLTAAQGLQPSSWDEYGGTMGFTFTRQHHSLLFSLKYGVLSGSDVVQASETVFEQLQVKGYDLAATVGASYHF